MSEVCFECGQEAVHNHHVVPKTLGGTKTVPLCEQCHSKVHGRDLSISALQREAVQKTIARYKAEGKMWGGGGWNRVKPEKCLKIKELRNQGFTLEKIAEQVGLSYPTVWKIAQQTSKQEARLG